MSSERKFDIEEVEQRSKWLSVVTGVFGFH